MTKSIFSTLKLNCSTELKWKIENQLFLIFFIIEWLYYYRYGYLNFYFFINIFGVVVSAISFMAG